MRGLRGRFVHAVRGRQALSLKFVKHSASFFHQRILLINQIVLRENYRLVTQFRENIQIGYRKLNLFKRVIYAEINSDWL